MRLIILNLWLCDILFTTLFRLGNRRFSQIIYLRGQERKRSLHKFEVEIIIKVINQVMIFAQKKLAFFLIISE